MTDWYKQQSNIAVNKDLNFATVVEVSTTNGVRLKFEDSNEATSKFYKCANGISLAVGDKVKVFKSSGTYIVEYKVGTPGQNATEISFKINGVSFTAKENQTWSNWLSSAYNTQGYIQLYKYGRYFLTTDGTSSTIVATIESQSTAITANRNYTNTLAQFQINGTSYNFYDPMRASAWVGYQDLNTDSYTLVYQSSLTPSGYYFMLNSTAVALFTTSTAGTQYELEKNHNYTMSG